MDGGEGSLSAPVSLVLHVQYSSQHHSLACWSPETSFLFPHNYLPLQLPSLTTIFLQLPSHTTSILPHIHNRPQNTSPTMASPTTATPTIHTYHCACTSLLLATTTALPSLPRRATSLDRAIILPLPSPAHPPASTPHTILLSLTADRRPTTIRRDDGFEKRTLWRCGRCRVVVGYMLDAAQFETVTTAAEEESGNAQKDGIGGEVLYILPGWLQSTEHMASGKKISERDAVLEGGQLGVAVWE
jgi:hypothetical protein